MLHSVEERRPNCSDWQESRTTTKKSGAADLDALLFESKDAINLVLVIANLYNFRVSVYVVRFAWKVCQGETVIIIIS